MTVEEGNQIKMNLEKKQCGHEIKTSKDYIAVALAILPQRSPPSETELNYLTNLTIQI